MNASAIAAQAPAGSGARAVAGWLLFLSALVFLAAVLPASSFTPGQKHYLFALTALAIWRFSLRLVHFVRAMIFLYLVFPLARRRARQLGAQADPPHVYLLVTSFRIRAETTAAVYRATIEEAIACGLPVTVVASIVELSDELLLKTLWRHLAPPPAVALKIVRIPGTGKRDGLAQGFRAISRDMPEPGSLVAVIDGDTVIDAGVVRKTVPYFKLFPNVGGLTTNEFCEVEGGYVMSEWHRLRFAQRHLSMCSMALTRRVLTLTGRMSMLRAEVVTDPGFIADVEADAIDHWRLGRFRFLTGDDKSTWYSMMRLGYDTWYVPDASIRTFEHPPDRRFWVASRKLMFRWYGNSLRQIGRALKLGHRRLGLFTTYVLMDQRLSMWTSLVGPIIVIVATLKYRSWQVLIGYVLWIGLTRLIMCALLAASGHRIGPTFPLLLYYNQMVGSMMKIKVSFYLDQQSWTRQNTQLKRELDGFQQWFNPWSSRVLLLSAASVFAALLIKLVSIRLM